MSQFVNSSRVQLRLFYFSNEEIRQNISGLNIFVQLFLHGGGDKNGLCTFSGDIQQRPQKSFLFWQR